MNLSWKLKTLAALVLLIILAAAAGCSSQDKAAANNGKEELVLALGSEPEGGFDPTTGWGRYGSPLFQSTLLTRDNDLKVINDLATSYGVSEDGLVWTVKVRNDVRFSDAAPVTAEDVAYTFATAANSGSVVDLTAMARVEAIDKQTVKFTLKQPRSTFINLLLTLGIVPKHAHNQEYAGKPIGSGPFKFVQWDKGQQLIVEANPEYYGPKPAFKKLTFLYLSEDAVYAAAQAGQVDVAAVPATLAKNAVGGMRLLPVGSVDNRGIMFPMVPAGGKTDKGYPIGNDVTSDPAIRKAINIAIDRRTLVEGVLNGYGSPAYTVCDNLPWWNPETMVKDADLEGAKKELADAGWQDADNDGTLDKGALKASFTLAYPASDQIRQALALAVSDRVRLLGIQIKAEGKSWDDIKTMMHSSAVLFGWGSHDPLEMYNLFSSKNAGNDYYNAGFYSNPRVDEYMDKALASTNEKEAFAFWQQAQWDGSTGLSARGDAPWAWLVNLDHCYLVREGLDTGKQRLEPHGHGWPMTANIAEWRWESRQ